MNAGAAWFSSSRNDFLLKKADAVVALLANHATKDGWHIEPEQHEEWTASVALLQEQFARKIYVLQAALSDPQLEEIETIILGEIAIRGLRSRLLDRAGNDAATTFLLPRMDTEFC